ncbi:MAG: DUF2878 domain-containing protein [Nitrospirota bacterium]
MNKIIVFAGFQVVWLVSVLSAAKEFYLLGPAAVICWLLMYAWRSSAMKREILLALLSGVVGFFVDTALIWLEAFFPQGVSGSLRLSPAWMIGLWLNFATSLNSLLGWLKGRYILSALIGLIGGPAAYYSGASLGAAVIPQPLLENLILIGAGWSISLTLLVWLSSKIR